MIERIRPDSFGSGSEGAGTPWKGTGEAGVRSPRGDEVVATRIPPGPLQERLRTSFEVRPGTRAILLDGDDVRYVGTLLPGTHSFSTLKANPKLPAPSQPWAVVVEDGELALDFVVDDLHAADGHKVALHAQAAVRVAEPMLFLVNAMRERSPYRMSDLVAALADEIRESVKELVRRNSAVELHRGRLRTALEMELLSRWKAAFDRTGLALNRFRVLSFDAPGLREAEEIRASTGDSVVVRAARREERSAIFESELEDLRLEGERFVRLKRQEAENELTAARAELERLQKREDVLRQLQKAQIVAQMTDLESAAEWAAFKRRHDANALLAESDWRELQADVDAKTTDAALKREAVTELLKEKIRHEQELQQIHQNHEINIRSIRSHGEITRLEQEALDEQVRGQIRREKEIHDAKLAERRDWFEQQLGERTKLAELEAAKVQRQQDTMTQLGKIQQTLTTAKADAKIAESTAKVNAAVGYLEAAAKTSANLDRDTVLAILSLTKASEGDLVDVIRSLKSNEVSEARREGLERLIHVLQISEERREDRDHQKTLAALGVVASQSSGRGTGDGRRGAGVRPESVVSDAGWIICPACKLSYEPGRTCACASSTGRG